MIDPSAFARTFLNTFDKSAADPFRRWLALHPTTTKWILGADFALRDRNHPGDCFAFSLIPYDMLPADFAAEVRSALPRDLKDSRSLPPDAAAWLRNPRHFHIVIPMNRERAFYDNGAGSRAQCVARDSLRITLAQTIDHQRGADCTRRVKAAVGKSEANAFNVGLFTDLTLLALYLPIITLILARERKPAMIGWFCDRDRMNAWGDRVIWNFARENLGGLAEQLDIDVSGVEPVIAVPERRGGSEVMWFDHYIRSADWLAGTLATWDRTQALDPLKQEKYVQVIEDVLADSQNAVILPVIMDREEFQVSRLLLQRTPPSTPQAGSVSALAPERSRLL